MVKDDKKKAMSRRHFLRNSVLGATAATAAAYAPAIAMMAEDMGRSPSSSQNGGVTQAAVIEALKTVRDPEIPINVYDLGLVYGIDIPDPERVGVRMTLTTPTCPGNAYIPEKVKSSITRIGARQVYVQIVWDPPWTPEMMSETARRQFEWGLWDLPMQG